MNASVEQQLRLLYAEQVADYDPQPAVDRLLARRSYRQHHRGRLRATAGAFCALVGSDVAAAATLLPSCVLEHKPQPFQAFRSARARTRFTVSRWLGVWLCAAGVCGSGVAATVLLTAGSGEASAQVVRQHFAVLSSSTEPPSSAALQSFLDAASQVISSERSFPSLPMVASYGLEFDQAVAVSYSTESVVIVPGTSGTCVWRVDTLTDGPAAGVTGGGGSCATNNQVLNRGLLGVGSGGGATSLYGIVPNGNTQIQMTMPDGTSQSVTVKDNTFDIQLSGGDAPQSVTFTNASGSVVTRRW